MSSETPICFFIDEIQYMKQAELRALIAALHRTNQLAREPTKKVNVCYTDEAVMVS